MGQDQEVIREYVTNQDGRITISATELTMRYFLLPFMERFQHCFPNVKLQIHAHSFPTAITSLREETSDFALSITPLDNCYDFEITQVSDFQDILKMCIRDRFTVSLSSSDSSSIPRIAIISCSSLYFCSISCTFLAVS